MHSIACGEQIAFIPVTKKVRDWVWQLQKRSFIIAREQSIPISQLNVGSHFAVRLPVELSKLVVVRLV